MGKPNKNSLLIIFGVVGILVLTIIQSAICQPLQGVEIGDKGNENNGRTKRDTSSSSRIESYSQTPGVNRIVNFLQRKNIYKVYNLNRALEEWRKLDRSQAQQNMKEIIEILVEKSSADYDQQKRLAATNPNITGNSLIFRALLKFYVESSPTGSPLKYKLFDYLSDQLESRGNLNKMSLDDAIIFNYIWLQEIVNGGAVHSSAIGWSDELLLKHKERNIRTIVQAANRAYPEGPGENDVVTIADWWLRQRQNSRNVFKVYNCIKATVEGLKRERIESASIYETLVREYKKSGRSLDAFELNMIDYLSYQLFGFVENSDPDRW